MLIRFSVSNFLSFNEEQEITMIPGKIREKENHLINVNDIKLLSLATVYGANASGKSNLIKAIDFAKTVISRGVTIEATQMFCKNNKQNEKKESKFEFEFAKNNKNYAYGFTILLKEKKIISEWLYEINSKEQKMIFERELDGDRFEDNLKLSLEDNMRLTTYKLDFQGNTDILFLNEINRNKKLSKESALYIFKEVNAWFVDDLRIIYPEQPITKFEYFYGNDNDDRINKIIQLFDTGISKIKLENISYDKLTEELSKEVVEEFMGLFKNRLNSLCNEKDAIRMSLRTRDSFYNISGKMNSEPIITTIKTEHGKSLYDFDFKDESDGTRRLFDLLDILLNNNANKVYIVDELERSLHPKLTYKFVELFIKLCRDKNIQLLFTSHEATIMEQELLRRDEIWFVERNNMNSTKIYSLDRFKERYDKKISKSYLEGRYGAVPVFKDFEFMEELT
ncbi:MAG: AAA family ATPase [Clostridium sp.]